MNPWRIAGWSGAALLLLLPAIAMQFTDEVNWGPGDFIVMGALLGGFGLALELALRHFSKLSHRVASGVALAAAFLLVWAELAVGIVGD